MLLSIAHSPCRSGRTLGGRVCAMPALRGNSVRLARFPRMHKSTLMRVNSGEAVGNASIVRKVNAEELEVAIQNRDRAMVVDFYATWCGPCVLMASELEKVATELGDKVEVLKIDTDENEELSSRLQIQALPTVLFISPEAGKPGLRMEGLVSAEAVKDVLVNNLGMSISKET